MFTTQQLTNLKQQRWVHLAQQGDVTAMERLYRSYLPLLNKEAHWRYEDLESDDLYSTLVLRFVELVRSYDAARNPYFPSYVKSYIHWAALDYLKRWRRRRAVEAHEMSPLLEPVGGEPAPSLTTEELFALVDRCHLSPRQQEVLELLYEGYTPQEIEAMLHVSASSFNNTRRRIREKCRQSPELMEALQPSPTIVPEGYVDRSHYMFVHSWGVE